MESLRLRTKEYPAKWVFRGKRSCGLIETAPRCLCQPVASGANLHSRGWSVGGAWVGGRWKVKGQEVAPNVNNSFRRDAFWHFLIHPIGRNGEASLKRIRRWGQPTAPPGGGNIWRIPEESRRDPRRIPVSCGASFCFCFSKFKPHFQSIPLLSPRDCLFAVFNLNLQN